MSKGFKSFALLVSLALLAASPDGHAQQRELTTSDRAAALYSTRFSFDAEHVPTVSVALMDGEDEVRLSTPGELRILPVGPSGPEIVAEPGLAWRARVEAGRPASVRYWVVLDAIPARRLADIRAARERFEALGLTVTTFEVGSVFSFSGQVLDSRKVLVAVDEAYDEHAKAKDAAVRAAEAHGLETGVHAKLDRRSSGTIVLENDRGTMTIRNADQMWLAPGDPARTIEVERVTFGRGFAWGGREDRRYRGTIYLAVDRRGKLAVVNSLDAESLLRGIVPSEIYPSSPMDALRAQAVVARGELLAKIGTRHRADPYLLCADVHCQAYSGVSKEHPRTDEAIRATRGEVLFDPDGGLVDSVYSASCGGHTEHNENVWPSVAKAPLRGRLDGPRRPAWLPDGEMTDETARRFLSEVSDGWCGRSSKGKAHYRWERSFTPAELEALVAEQRDVGPVRELKVLSRGVSGRALALEVTGARGSLTVERELPIRRLLGGLKSALFVVDEEKDAAGRVARFRLRGGGFGHGVGMCQVGAIGMAEAGHGYRDILAHYYRGGVVQKVY